LSELSVAMLTNFADAQMLDSCGSASFERGLHETIRLTGITLTEYAVCVIIAGVDDIGVRQEGAISGVSAQDAGY